MPWKTLTNQGVLDQILRPPLGLDQRPFQSLFNSVTISNMPKHELCSHFFPFSPPSPPPPCEDRMITIEVWKARKAALKKAPRPSVSSVIWILSYDTISLSIFVSSANLFQMVRRQCCLPRPSRGEWRQISRSFTYLLNLRNFCEISSSPSSDKCSSSAWPLRYNNHLPLEISLAANIADFDYFGSQPLLL